ncbi:MAG: hypothetical protein JNL52_04450 [Flavobacteriales bacterium]|nr:hypothetical protein [Flavobacteriales bacterium]
MEHDIHAPDAQGFIPGVYNYCDRRCERCRFVRQCRVGAVDVDDVGEAEDAVVSGRPEDLRERLMKLMNRPPSEAEDEDEDDEVDTEEEDDGDAGGGLDFDFDPADMEPTAEELREEEKARQALKAHPLSNMGMAYMDLVDEWLDPREEMLTAKGILVHRQQELSMAAAMRTPEILVLSEALDEIGWFKTMLHVKCQRAIRGKLEDTGWMKAMDMDPLQSDWNGTAKLCLEIVQRSVAAWETVAELMPEEAEHLVAINELLRRVDEELRKEFPDAQRFIRAGWDAPDQPSAR